MSRSVMIVTGESSGELYGALLAEKLFKRYTGITVLGVGGERMKEAGVEVFSGIASAFGLIEALSAYGAVKATYKKTVAELESRRPAVVVLIDYPDFNFKVGQKARELGIKVLYYVSPQVWAWRSGRIKKMAEFVDRMAVVLPFEEKLYQKSGITAEFVGHPIMDEMQTFTQEKHEARRLLGLDPDKPCIALLPGSRASELSRLLPLMLDTVRAFKSRFPDYGYFMPVAPNIEMQAYAEFFDNLRAEGVVVAKKSALLAFSAAEAALTASGTATLQGALRQTPMVVVYKINPLTHIIARRIIKAKYATLANLILDREAVPEFLQGRATTEAVMASLVPLVTDNGRRARMLDDLAVVRSYFTGRGASQRVSEIVGEMGGFQA